MLPHRGGDRLTVQGAKTTLDDFLTTEASDDVLKWAGAGNHVVAAWLRKNDQRPCGSVSWFFNVIQIIFLKCVLVLDSACESFEDFQGVVLGFEVCPFRFLRAKQKHAPAEATCAYPAVKP